MTPSFLSSSFHTRREEREAGTVRFELVSSRYGKSELCKNDRCENSCFLSIDHEPGTVLRAGHVNLTITLESRCYSICPFHRWEN